LAGNSKQGIGLGVDKYGGAVIDPTKNVLDLTAAANRRQDDLREMYNRFMGAEIRRLEETVKRVEQVSELHAQHMREVAMIHQSHDMAIHKMEQEKLAAFRASDEVARLTEANRSLAAIQVVERTLNSTATALASQNAENNLEVNRRLAALEKSSYEGAGKQAVADPMQAEMLNEFRAMRLSFAEGQGKAVVTDPLIANMMAEQKRTNEILAEKMGGSKGMDKMWGYAVAAVGLLYIVLKLAGKM